MSPHKRGPNQKKIAYHKISQIFPPNRHENDKILQEKFDPNRHENHKILQKFFWPKSTENDKKFFDLQIIWCLVSESGIET